MLILANCLGPVSEGYPRWAIGPVENEKYEGWKDGRDVRNVGFVHVVICGQFVVVGEIEIVRNDWLILEALYWCSPSTYDNSFIHAVFCQYWQNVGGSFPTENPGSSWKCDLKA